MRSALLLLLALTLPASARDFDVRPAPSWVEHVDAPDVAVARENTRWGIYDVLKDHQVRALGGVESQYFRTVRKVLSASGVQNASELTLEFDPSFERLTIHEVSIVRGAQRIDALEPGEVRVIEKEDSSDDGIYDGERTAIVFVKDVRPGDTLDYSWSIDGSNPILGGRYTDEYDLSSAVPAARIRHRLLWPAGRRLNWRGAKASVSASGAAQILTWEARDVRALVVEDSVPSWYEPWQSVQVSEFASWAEVAQWSDAMFQVGEESARAVHALGDRIRGEHKTIDAQITAAIRFVQDDIRYLGIEMGRSSHEPHQPSETLEARWGDCKDKTLLLTALLRDLGLQAYPALVSTRLQQRLDDKLPSPFLFDHVITQVVYAGKTYWVDGTIADQGGTLETLDTPNDRRALVVRGTTTALTPVVTNEHGSTHVQQRYTTRDFSKPTTLEVHTTYEGGDADAMRAQLASYSRDDFARQRINALAVDQPKIEAGGALRVEDDRTRNVIHVREKYRIPGLWQDGHWTWYPRLIEGQLSRPETMIRSMPLAFDFPLDVRQTVTFDFPEDVEVEKSTSATETPAFRYDYSVDSNGRSVTIAQSLRARRDYVPAADISDHLTKLNAISSEIGYRLAPAGAQSRPAAETKGARWGLALFAVAMFVGICLMLAMRKGGAPSSVVAYAPAGFGPGDAPMSALAVGRAGDIDHHLAKRACTCGSTTYSEPEMQRARYADRDLTIVTRNCGRCGREQSVYFTAA